MLCCSLCVWLPIEGHLVAAGGLENPNAHLEEFALRQLRCDQETSADLALWSYGMTDSPSSLLSQE